MLHCIHRNAVFSGRCLKILSSAAVAFRGSQNIHLSSKTLLPSSDHDLPTPMQMIPAQKLYANDTDILLEQLKRSHSVHRTLELVSMHLDVMNNNHIAMSFSSIYNNLKKDSPLSSEGLDVVNNETFQLLCSRVMDRARHLDLPDVISIFKTLTRINVSSNTYIVQVLLKVLCSHINDLDLNQLTFVNYLIAKHRPTALVDSLRLALPLVLQVQIDQQLNSDNLQEVVNSLRMACQARLKPSSIEKIINCLQKKVTEFSPENASSIIFGLFSLDIPVDGYMKLINSCFEIVITNIDQVQRSYLLTLARFCVLKSYYSTSFFSRLCKQAVCGQWSFNECFELMFRMQKLNFFSPDLLDLLAERIISDASCVKKEKSIILSITEMFTYASYPCEKVHEVLSILSSEEEQLNAMFQKQPGLYLKTISCWAMLNYFPEALVRKVLDENYLQSCWSISRKIGRSSEFEMHVCCLQWSIEACDQTERFQIPPNFMKKIFQTIQQSHLKSSKFPLTKFLENGLGGPQFFQTAVLTRNGHVIDHVLAMRTGNYPISFNLSAGAVASSTNTYLEDIKLPDDTKLIGVIVANDDNFTTFPELLKFHLAMRLRSLSKMNICPVIINYDKWSALPDREKIPFLMREVKEVNGNLNIATSNPCPA